MASRMPLLLAAVLASVTLDSVALAPSAAGARPDLELTSFVTPSRNIECLIGTYPSGANPAASDQFVRCDVRRTYATLPPRPRDCDLDWGTVATLAPAGRGQWGACVSDAVGPGAVVLAYGKSINKAPFRCTSRTTGLTCTNRAGHGFRLSREYVRTF